jgi:hypothetical protein
MAMRAPRHNSVWLALRTVAVAQTRGGLTEAFLRVRSKKPQVVARPRRALLGLGAASPFSDRHSERGPGFRRRLCATATTKRSRPRPRRTRACFRGWLLRKRSAANRPRHSRPPSTLATPAQPQPRTHTLYATASGESGRDALPSSWRISGLRAGTPEVAAPRWSRQATCPALVMTRPRQVVGFGLRPEPGDGEHAAEGHVRCRLAGSAATRSRWRRACASPARRRASVSP